jgi:hypothetical protein
MSSGSLVELGFYTETAYKVAPIPVNLQLLRYVRESLKTNQTFIESPEVTASRTTLDSILVDLEVAGTLETVLSYETYDDFLKALLQSDADWSAPVDKTGNTYTVSAVNTYKGPANAFDGYLAHEWVRVTGSNTPANDGYRRVVGGGGTDLVVQPPNLVIDPVGHANFVMRKGSRILNGKTMPSFGFQRRYADLVNEYVRFTGIMVDSGEFSIAARQMNSIRFGLVGATEASATTDISVGGSIIPISTSKVTNAVRHVKLLRENYVDFKAIRLGWQVRNNITASPAIGVLGPDERIQHDFQVTGSWTAYYKTKAIADKSLAETETNLLVVVQDIDGNDYLHWFPRVKIESFERVGGGKNADVLYEVQWRALDLNGQQYQIAKFDA